MTLIEDIRSALAHQDFEVYFQPIISLRDNTVVKAEALTRWNHADRGPISPGVFIPLAEQSGLITRLGEMVTDKAISFAVQVRKTTPNFQVSFNMSPAELGDTPAQHQERVKRIEAAGLPGSALIVEITEGLLLKADETVRENIQIYRNAELAFAIDDFGTGYSSLAYLQSLEVNWIKIDQSFVSRLDGQFDSLVLVKAMIVMAHELGLQVIAEGVETEKQRDLLRSIDCDFAQGFLYSPALPPEQFFDWQREWTSESHL
jgi:EAL domain-containing protein (putative c-di-GMP-specific phosphodiesterase class I)